MHLELTRHVLTFLMNSPISYKKKTYLFSIKYVNSN